MKHFYTISIWILFIVIYVNKSAGSDDIQQSTIAAEQSDVVTTVANSDEEGSISNGASDSGDLPKSTTITTTTTTITVTETPILSTSINSTISQRLNSNPTVPADCSQRERLKKQPIVTNNSRLKKCCPLTEGLSLFGDNANGHECDSTDLEFNPKIISVSLYDNCIEDDEINVTLPIEIGNSCDSSIIYNDVEDMLFVLQDGSLLIMDPFGNESYTVESKYCLDIDNVSGTTYAIICITAVEEHLERGHILAIAVSMLLSIPCLIFVSYLHITIKEFRTLHGLSLGIMSLCLAIGYFLNSIVHITNIKSMTIGYCIQFFILSYFFWYFCLCINVFINIWLKIPCNQLLSKTAQRLNFTFYFVVAFSMPAMFVMLTYQKGLQGMPSYFIKGLTESIRDSQRYFIPPVSTVLFLSFIVMCLSYFGFRKIKKSKDTTQNSPIYTKMNVVFDDDRYCEVKKDAKCISLLGIIMITTWMLEIVTFYSQSSQGFLLLLDFINGLQGVFIMLIFVVIRRRRTVILRWWFDRGDHSIEDYELTAVTEQQSRQQQQQQQQQQTTQQNERN